VNIGNQCWGVAEPSFITECVESEAAREWLLVGALQLISAVLVSALFHRTAFFNFCDEFSLSVV
jgi:hypothetical protein